VIINVGERDGQVKISFRCVFEESVGGEGLERVSIIPRAKWDADMKFRLENSYNEPGTEGYLSKFGCLPEIVESPKEESYATFDSYKCNYRPFALPLSEVISSIEETRQKLGPINLFWEISSNFRFRK